MKLEISPQALTSPGRAIAERQRWETALVSLVDRHMLKFLDTITETILEERDVNPNAVEFSYHTTISDILEEIEGDPDTLAIIEAALLDDPLPNEVFDTASYVLNEAKSLRLDESQLATILREALDYDNPSITDDPSLQASAVPRIIGQALARSVGRGKRWRNRTKETTRTAATSALNETQSRVLQRSTYTHKQWITRRDDIVRASHSAADGQTVPKASLFQVGSAMLSYPGQGSYPPEEVANCRCVMIGVNADGST